MLVEGVGVEGDAHAGETVKHRSRVKRDPTQPNLRQVHLISHELLDALNEAGYDVLPGLLGENVTTKGFDLLEMATGDHLRFPSGAEIQITGLRNPCYQLDDLQGGLKSAVLERGQGGELIRKAGIMAIVVAGGTVASGDAIVLSRAKDPTPLSVV